jgi:BirA family biotin operon repressor/biotin-[acetyl-CoA-carboxylase] ligase
MNAPREVWRLDTRRLGRRVLVFDRVDSTNTVAAALAGLPENDGLAVLADEQTAGRGQHGRSWLAPAGAGVLLSVVWAPPPALCRPVVLTAWAAVAVCRVVHEAVGLPPRIKWPNDVLLGGRKVCGILIEQGPGGATVVGLGLNVRQSEADLAAAGLVQATSLAAFTQEAPSTAKVARSLIWRLDEDYDQLCQGEAATLEALWKWHVGLLGRSVVAQCADGAQRGRLVEMGFEGLELESPGQPRLVLRPEAVLHLEAEEG